MLTMIVEAHGERQGAVTVRACAQDKEWWFCDPKLSGAMIQIHDIVARLLWPVGEAARGVVAVEVEIAEAVAGELPAPGALPALMAATEDEPCE